MPEAVKEVPVTKKRAAKPGTRRVTVSLSEGDYKSLVELSNKQMREPNNMLSFMLASHINAMIADELE